MKRLLLLSLLALLPACGIIIPPVPIPVPTPTPTPTPPPTPPPPPGATPAKGIPQGPERLLRTEGTHLKTNDGKAFSAVQAIPCCVPFAPDAARPAVPRPAPFRIAGVEKPTLWPLASDVWMDYTHLRSAANLFHFRGPFVASAEAEWSAIGGAYLPGSVEFNPAYWQKERDLVWHAYQLDSYVEKVAIDTWGCKYAQAGNEYLPWSQEAIDACGRTWHPEHERYVRKVVEELGCFGNVVWALDNEGQGIRGWQAPWFLNELEIVRDEEQKSGCGFVHLVGTSVDGAMGRTDYSITHARAALTAPLEGHWTLNNEHNPEFSPDVEARYFADARALGLAWGLWRAGASEVDYGRTLDLVKVVVDGGEPPPPVGDVCPKPLAPGAYVYMHNKVYGQGKDSKPYVKGDPEFCRLIHGVSVGDCHIEGWPRQLECELQLLGATVGKAQACPVWEYTLDDGTSVHLCVDDQSTPASCDHFGNPEFRDDPQTPDVFEGQPAVCGLQRDSQGRPMAGFFTIFHGQAKGRACPPGRQAGTCGPWGIFDHSLP